VLQENNKSIPKIHNLVELMLLCEEVEGSFEMLRADLVTMERYAVRGRYPARRRKRKMLELPMPRLGRCESLSGRSWD